MRRIKQEQTFVSTEDDPVTLREEAESLAEFLHVLRREYAQLHRDFAAVLRASGGTITVSAIAHPESGTPSIERVDDPTTGTTTFRLRE